MAKRKRLSPANPLFTDTPPLETKAAAPPIAGVAGDSSATAALQELADSVEAARKAGLMIVQVPLTDIALDHLVRDRMVSDPEDMEVLKESLRARGQQTPVELTEIAPGRYGLISGWRRCTALTALHAETADPKYASVLGLVRQPKEASDAYVAMVEENEIRAELSYYERARIVVMATERGVFPNTRMALKTLFQSASRPRRSKIGSFLPIVDAFDGLLAYPETIGERLGLRMARALEDNESFAPRLRSALRKGKADSAEAEHSLIERLASETGLLPPTPGPEIQAQEPSQTSKPSASGPLTSEHVTLHMDKPGQLVLSGPGLTSDVRLALAKWLQKHTGGVR